MRKAINFFRSYYDIAKELNDKDRLAFYDAILNKQFENIDTQLTGMAKFAYVSQKHSISAQIKGYYDKTKDAKFNPLLPPTVGATEPPYLQVQEKEQEKEEVQYIIKKPILNIIEQYFIDFENGTNIIEMARMQKTTPEKLKSFIPYFKLKVNAEYQNYGKFIDHFRNSYLLNKDKINNDTQKGGRVLE